MPKGNAYAGLKRDVNTMTPQEIAATAAAEKADAEFEATLEGMSDEDKELKRAERANGTLQSQHEAELKREREAREKAEKALAERRFKESEARRQAEAGGIGEDDDKPLTGRQLEEILARERQQTQKELQASRIETLARQRAETETEAALMVEIHKNRNFPTHLSLDEQMEEVWLIANRKKIIGERDEALRALRGRDGVNNNSAGTHLDPPTSPVRIAPDMKFVLTQQGFVENRTTGRYEKKLPNGKMLVGDPRTGTITPV